MGKVMNNIDFANKAKEIATNFKTLYIMGCFGAPMNNTNKNRYCNNHSYNKQAARTNKIKNASADTFGFDCVCLIKGILWGWAGNLNKTYGGAVYKANGVPDVGADGIMNYCTNVSKDFSNIEIGEVVHMSGHVGIYIGNGLAVECTPIWKDGVQITAVGNIGAKSGYNKRTWTNHGKLNFIDYNQTGSNTEEVKPESNPSKTIDELAKEVIDGKWGNNPDRKNRLIAAGYDYAKVQARVNEILAGNTPKPDSTPSVDILTLVKKTIRGDFGNGDARKKALGNNYAEVQRQVNLNYQNKTTNWDNVKLY